MNWICGLFTRTGSPIEPGTLEAMLGTMAYAPHEQVAHLQLDGVGLGNQTRWITAEERTGSQPFQCASSRLAITADARLDNRSDLFARLGLPGHPPISDAELILLAYQRWEENCLSALVGDFAFAIWDPGKRELFCARDYIGAKPFYYYLDHHQFVFGSEIKAILAAPGVPRKPAARALALYLTQFRDDRETSWFEDILRLPAATILRVTPDRVERKTYWTADDARPRNPLLSSR